MGFGEGGGNFLQKVPSPFPNLKPTPTLNHSASNR